MIIEHRHYEHCDQIPAYIWIDESLPPDFERRLLIALLARARPADFGSGDAPGRKAEHLDAIIQENLRTAAQKHGLDGGYWFDYVDGHRLKVQYLPCGFAILENSSSTRRRNPGMPLVVSSEFDAMYGNGALAGAIEQALMFRSGRFPYQTSRASESGVV